MSVDYSTCPRTEQRRSQVFLGEALAGGLVTLRISRVIHLFRSFFDEDDTCWNFLIDVVSEFDESGLFSIGEYRLSHTKALVLCFSRRTDGRSGGRQATCRQTLGEAVSTYFSCLHDVSKNRTKTVPSFPW